MHRGLVRKGPSTFINLPRNTQAVQAAQHRHKKNGNLILEVWATLPPDSSQVRTRKDNQIIRAGKRMVRMKPSYRARHQRRRPRLIAAGRG